MIRPAFLEKLERERRRAYRRGDGRFVAVAVGAPLAVVLAAVVIAAGSGLLPGFLLASTASHAIIAWLDDTPEPVLWGLAAALAACAALWLRWPVSSYGRGLRRRLLVRLIRRCGNVELVPHRSFKRRVGGRTVMDVIALSGLLEPDELAALSDRDCLRINFPDSDWFAVPVSICRNSWSWGKHRFSWTFRGLALIGLLATERAPEDADVGRQLSAPLAMRIPRLQRAGRDGVADAASAPPKASRVDLSVTGEWCVALYALAPFLCERIAHEIDRPVGETVRRIFADVELSARLCDDLRNELLDDQTRPGHTDSSNPGEDTRDLTPTERFLRQRD